MNNKHFKITEQNPDISGSSYQQIRDNMNKQV